MSFIDYIFIPFIFLVIICYFLAPLKYRWMVLLITSVFYFCTWGIESLPFVIGASFIAWFVSLIIENWSNRYDTEIRSNESIDQKQKNILYNKIRKRCKYVLCFGVASVLGVLIFTKTQNILAGLLHCIGVVIEANRFEVITILGVSYYTMSLIGYMADVYWRKEKAERNFFKLLLFTTYFPKILQGPISKYKNIKEQLYNGNRFDYRNFCYGLQRMLWGYFKKLVIADRLLLFISPVFENHKIYNGSILLLAAIFSAIQMYCDFSGCMDIALGISEVFGIKLEENFRRPFSAKSVPEFWTRWHISLSTWFKDYVYMPIVISPRMIKISSKIKKIFGKNAAKHFMTIVPTIIVWTITGLWHGTGWNYIAWGGFWAILFVLSTVFGPKCKKINSLLSINTETLWFQKFRQLRTISLFVICRIIVTPGNLQVTKEVFRKIFFNFGPWQLLDGTLFTVGLDRANLNVLIIALFLLYIVSMKQESGIKIRDEVAGLPLVLRWIVYIIGIFSVLILGIYGPGYDAASFVYMNF